jgi:NADPH:quinone reductase-like Zn-dependent oxidoreductase
MSSSAQTMRAVHLRDGKGNAGALFLGDALRPAPGLGQVLVTIHAFGLNRMDIMQRNGMYPGACSPCRVRGTQRRCRRAVPKGASEILGVEFAETVAHVGPPPAEDDYGAEAKVCARRSGAGRRAKRSSGSSTVCVASLISSRRC